MASPSPQDPVTRPVDFSNPDGRQNLFKEALGQASLDQSFLTRKTPVVTFNNNVEEITTSIVSIADSTHSRTDLEDDLSAFASVQESGDMYMDDELTGAEEEPVNIQLLSQVPAERKVGDRVLCQFPGDGGWYPATVSILSGHQATVAFDHNLQLRTVDMKALRDVHDSGGDSRFVTVLGDEEQEEAQDVVEKEEEEEDNGGDEEDQNIRDEEANVDEEAHDDEEGDVTGFRTAHETVWKEGDQCVAQWDEDGLWYKAVIDTIEVDRAVVTFTEYGNSAYAQLAQLRDYDTPITEHGLLEDQQDDEWS